LNTGLIWIKDTNTYQQIDDGYVELIGSAKSTVCAVRLTSKSEDEQEQSELYVTAYDENGNIIEFRNVPSAKDEIRVSGGKAELVQRVGKLILNGEIEWTQLYSTDATTYRITAIDFRILHNISPLTSSNSIAASSVISYETTTSTSENNVNKVVVNDSAPHLYVRILKSIIDNVEGTTTIEKIKNYLNQYPITLTYQLAEPVIIENVKVKYFLNGVESGGLSCFGPNTTVMQEPVVTVETKPNEYNQIQLPTDKGLVELVGCYKDSGIIMVDCLEDATLDTETGIVTINGADITKDYFVAATIDKSNTTLGTIGMRYPI